MEKMKTPNKQTKFILNKFPFNTSKKLSLNKFKKTIDISSSIYDEIELKDKQIRDSDRQMKNIKIESIKQFVYANKKIPERWKTKQDYQNQVLKIFAKDPKFLYYVGNNNDNNNNNMSKSIQYNRNNLTTTSCFQSNLNKTNNNINESNKQINLSILTDNNKIQKTNNMKKYIYTTPVKKRYISLKNKALNEKEMIYILDNLQRKFPIKEKLNELYPKEELEKVGIKSHTIKKKESRGLNIRYPFLPSRKMKTFLKKNIYINLIPSNKDSEKTQEEDYENLKIFDKKTINDDIENDVSKMKKEMIKNPLAKKHLESINYYGPYYSYCTCGNKNLSFYQKLSLNQLVKITNYIHQYREKKYK